MRDRLGRYEIREHLAQGGMGELYVGRGDGDTHDVVLKCVEARTDADPRHSRTRMFLDEARVTTLIRHPNVVRVHEVNYEEGVYYLVMEKLEGWDLAMVSERLRQVRELLPVPMIARIVAEACRGLHAAHECTTERGEPLALVHRDVSPGNLFLTEAGTLKVLDFGIAKTSIQVAKTRVGYVKGKFSYMSPEQARGDELDRRSDLFSVGIVLHELLTGGRLFTRDSPHDTVDAILHDIVVPPARADDTINADTAAVAMRALTRDPDLRFASAAEMADALGRGCPGAARVRAGDVAGRLTDLFGGDKGPAIAPSVPASDSHSLREWAQTLTETIRAEPLAGDDTVPQPTHTDAGELTVADTVADAGELTVADTVADAGVLTVADTGELTVADTTHSGLLTNTTPTLERLPTDGSSTIDIPRAFRQWPAVFVAAGLILIAGVTWVAWPEPVPAPAQLASPAPPTPPRADPPPILRTTPAVAPEERPTRTGTAETRSSSRRPATKRPRPPAKVDPPSKSKGKRTRATGRLTLDSKPWANVYINQRLLGPTPLVEHALPAGKVSVRLSNPQLGIEKTVVLEIPANELLRTTVRLER